jgi:hypothetical protein
MDLLRMAALGTGLVGMAIAVLALVSLIRSASRVPDRLRPLGFVYLGMSVMCAAGVLYVLAAAGDGRLQFVAAVVPVLILGVTYFRLRAAYLRAFAGASQGNQDGPHVTFTDAD